MNSLVWSKVVVAFGCPSECKIGIHFFKHNDKMKYRFKCGFNLMKSRVKYNELRTCKKILNKLEDVIKINHNDIMT